MNVWYHLPTILKQRRALQVAGLVAICVALITTLFLTSAAFAAPGANQTLNFQGRLLNSSGGTVPDGYYNIQFKIYQDGDGQSAGNATGSPAGSLKWTESHINNGGTSGVKVKNGYFSVVLGSKTAFGSSIDWNQDTLWLSMNVAGSAISCTTFGSGACTADGEMLPMKRLTAVPYAMQAQNANTLGGMEASDLVHNQNTAQQTSSNFWISGVGRADTTLQAPVVDTATAGTLTIGGTNATSITMADDVTVAAGKSLTLAGGNTASRPASPSEGTMYFDTDTKQLLVYANGKWQGDKAQAVIVAASDSTQAEKDSAQFVGNGTTDDVAINAAIASLPSGGGTVYLLGGTYHITSTITLDDDIVLAGNGKNHTTHLVREFTSGTNNGVIYIEGSRVTVRGLYVDGNRSTYSATTNHGIYMSGDWNSEPTIMDNYSEENGGNGLSMAGIAVRANRGGTITNNTLSYNGQNGFSASYIFNTQITYNTMNENDGNGFNIGDSEGISISDNSASNNGNDGFGIHVGNTTVTRNTSQDNAASGIGVNYADGLTINGNFLRNNAYGVGIANSDNVTVNANTIRENGKGVALYGVGSNKAITDNAILDSDDEAIYANDDRQTLTISGNSISNSGGSGGASAIYLQESGKSSITNNKITDIDGTGYAIRLDSNASDTLLSGNIYSGTGASSILDNGTNTTYSNQLDASGKLINKAAAGASVQTSTNSTTGFTVQNASGTSALTVDTTTNSVYVAGTFDTATATTLAIGSTNASSITIGGTSTVTTVQGALRANTIDAASATTLTIGSTNATSINLAQNVTVAAGKSLTLEGGNTASRPASPTEGAIYYDTTTHQLLTYNGSKWVADKADSVIVAASNSSQSDKDAANYVADGTSDQTEINAALTAAAGKKVILLAGTYSANATITIPNNTTLAGVGAGSLVQLADIDATDNLIENSDTSTGTGVTIQDLKIDGQDTLNTAGTQSGIYFNNMGDYTASRSGSVIRNVQISNFRSQGIFYNSSDNNTISGSTISGMDAGGATLGIYLESSSRNNNITDNVFTGNSYSIRADGSGTTNNSIAQNVFRSNSYGIMLYSATNTSITGNNFDASTNYSVSIYNDSGANGYNNVTSNSFRGDGVSIAIENMSNNTVNNNKINDSGSTTGNNAIRLIGNADRNTVSSNSITDSSCTTTCYAITITASTGDVNMLSDNSLGSNGTISDSGTGTIYANQLDANGKLINKSAAGSSVQTSTNSTTAFQVQNAAGTSALTVNTTTNSVLIAGSLDTTTTAAMTIGSTNASSITIGNSSSNIATTVLGTSIFKPTTGNDSTTAFQIQRANGTAMFTADSTNQTITFGNAASGNYTVISTSTGAITKYGTARNTKSITLTPEFAGAVLDAQSDSACTSASNGTMTAGLDSVGRTNYYNWTSTQGTNQCYDVVVQVPVPAGFSGWQSNSISMKASNTSNASYGIAIIDSNGNYDANYGSSYASPGSLSTSWSNVATSSLSGTYTRNDYFTIKIRMTAKNSANIQLGNITLNYYSDN